MSQVPAQLQKYLKSKAGSAPRVFEVSTFAAFVELSTWLYSTDAVIFRGQTKEKGWPLVPSVGRDSNRSDYLCKEKEILADFKRQSAPFVGIRPENDWQWLALAQHNCLPTRLLDWSTNPLVGLWMAVKDCARDGEPGVVWVYKYGEDRAVTSTLDRGSPFEIGQMYVYFPEHISPLIQAQAGVFTVHYKEGQDPGRLPPVDECECDTDLLLTKIHVPVESFRPLQYQLFRVGISAASMNPGLTGIGEAIRYRYGFRSDEPGL
jgi:hypothetical protein